MAYGNPYFNPDFMKLRQPASQSFQAPVYTQIQPQQQAPIVTPQQSANINWQDMIPTAASAFTSGMNSQDGGNRFGVSSSETGTNVASGFAQGMQSGGIVGGVIGAAVSGVSGQVSKMKNINKNLKGLNTSPNLIDRDMYGNVQYNSELGAQNWNDLSDLNEAYDKSTGLQRITGQRKKIRNKRKQLEAGIKASQAAYNTAEVSDKARANSMEDYYDRMNKRNRMNNLYSIPKTYG